MKATDIEKRTLRIEASYRGGGIEIHLDGLKKGKYNGHRMTAYQNYLGGGMLGSIGNGCTYKWWTQDAYLCDIAEDLARYFHKQTNHADDEWESCDFESNQRRPMSAY